MKKMWLIPAAFFAVSCVLNLTGCLISDALERCVKPALMPLLCLTTVAYILPRSSGRLLPQETCHPRHRKREGPTSEAQWEGSRSDAPEAVVCRKNGDGLALLFCGQLFGFAGDTMLLGKGFSFFAGGVGLFLAGHIFYICLFGGRSWKGLKVWQWVAALAVCLALDTGIISAIGVNGAMLAPMGIYGFVLTLLMFSTFAGALKFGGATWWLLFAGALIFTFSDSLIAVRNFGTLSHFMGGFVVMLTYLAAQMLLAVGGARLVLGLR